MLMTEQQIKNKFWELVYSGEIEVINNQNFDYVMQLIFKEGEKDD